ncbi:DUF1643 domain-containing protein [Salipiger sp. IMCC34102]|uniref:DUF1643 domain-containing protein n=1 Tax=Salipiger sp. IMCC34102 TaxID=2510647 RepID=UPI00101C17FD|nr:DUF1643 domain-containing protein [Salipiger sp. IMCC34102]RYH03914.1 DUF1643 domain-containing protein [Salipiger sp. IMCC34102]
MPRTEITRHHTAADGTRSTAIYSACETYRYALYRDWCDAPALTFVMLNPSTATEAANDPTIARCEARARSWGYGGLRIANLFAFRATYPRDLKAAADPVGPDADHWLGLACAPSGLVIAGWGVHGAHLDRDQRVRALLKDAGTALHALGLTKHGHPRHPLYVAYSRLPERWL